MTKFRRFFLVGATLLLSALLSGCHFAILDPKGVIAASEKRIFVDSIYLMLMVVVPVVIMSFVIPWRYRASNTKATYTPDWAHSTIMEVIWWTIPCVIILILSIWTWVYTHKLDPYRPIAADKDTLMVEAIAMDWKWLFIYPEQHMASVNFMELPVNKPVRIFISSDAPMNSLEIPRLAGQIYAMTGMQTKLNLIPSTIGTYTGLSTNFSGNGFSGMNFKVNVVNDTDFNAWVEKARQSPNELTLDAYNALSKPSENNPVEYFSNPKRGLFTWSVVKYMGPMPGMVLGYASTEQGREAAAKDATKEQHS